MRILPIALLLLATPLFAQGTPEVSAAKSGSYKADKNHTQVVFTYSHFGFNLYTGMLGNIGGTLILDTATPAKSKVSIDIPLADVVTTSAKLNEHLQSADFFDTAKYPTAHFESTSVVASGTTAKITGNLTLHGVTKPVVLDARFVGAGGNPMSKVDTIGFTATTSVKRGDFGITKLLPMVSDAVDLRITVAFEKTAA